VLVVTVDDGVVTLVVTEPVLVVGPTAAPVVDDSGRVVVTPGVLERGTEDPDETEVLVVAPAATTDVRGRSVTSAPAALTAT
jgi:hypothetical protein